jgi:P-type E1-E2 ATPase
LGSIAMFNDGAAAGDGPVARAIERAMAEGRSITCVGRDGHIEGVFAFDETLRPEAARTIAVLESRGYALAILTGDHPRRAESVGAALGVIPLAGLLPEDKVSALRELRSRSGPVAMVGDGLNDAPALALADVGIAMGCGADLTRETADVCLLGSDLRLVPWVLDLSRRTVRTIRQNLFWAFAYNTVGIALAMSGRLSPILAAGAMVVSSLLVVGNSMRLSHMPSVERAPAPAREADPCTTAGT